MLPAIIPKMTTTNRNISERDRKLDGLDSPDERLRLEWKDILAIVIAIYRIFLPWAAIFAGIYALLMLAFDILTNQ